MADVPSNAPEHCPGTTSQAAGTADACQGCPNQAVCATAPKGPDPDLAAIAERMSAIKHKILVLSGKGGVGKSTFAAQLAFALATQGKEVGLLDIDICGPSVPKMLGLEGQEVHQSALGWSPVYVEENLAVMSIGFMLPNPDDAVIWRGPRKNSLIKQFLKDVHWGALDYLVVDAPPGTSDEHISIAQFLQADPVADGAVIVTTPQEVAIIDVRKEVSFCRKVGLNVLGVVENMAGLRQRLDELRFLAPAPAPAPADAAANTAANGQHAANGHGVDGSAGVAEENRDVTAQVLEALRSAGFADPGALIAAAEVFSSAGGGAAHMCKQLGLKLLGRVPLDPHLGKAAEEGRAVFEASADEVAAGQAAAAKVDVPSAAALKSIVAQLLSTLEA